MKRTVFATAMAAFTLALATPVPALVSLSHAEHGAQAGQLQLDQGRKWVTDEALRRHMNTLRDALAERRQGIVERSLSAREYADLGGRIEQAVIAILSDCRLAPEADRNLHLIVAELVQASDTLQGRTEVSFAHGASKALRAVQLYATYFEHPGWRPVF